VLVLARLIIGTSIWDCPFYGGSAFLVVGVCYWLDRTVRMPYVCSETNSGMQYYAVPQGVSHNQVRGVVRTKSKSIRKLMNHSRFSLSVSHQNQTGLISRSSRCSDLKSCLLGNPDCLLISFIHHRIEGNHVLLLLRHHLHRRGRCD
jgi:hypothetical protein